LRKEQKAEVVAQIAAQIEAAEAVYAVDYRGLTVTQAAELRTRLREADARFRVVKNTLSLRAADQAGAEQLKALVSEGPTALTFVQGDPALAAKALDVFSRQAQVLELKGGLLGDRALDVEELRRLARLPAREQLNAQLAGVVASPLTGLARGLGALVSGLAIALGQVREQKEKEAPAAAAPAETQAADEPEAEAGEAPAAPDESPEQTPAEAPAAAAEADGDGTSNEDSAEQEKEAEQE